MNKSPTITICGRKIGSDFSPLVIAEIGINHEGSFDKAVRMVDDAFGAGCECVKFQSHIIEDEMIPNDVIPGNAKESIWAIMKRCALTEEQERDLKAYVESKKMIFLSTPFSRAAAIRLEQMGVTAYKIGSGECNNFPLIKHIATYGKPIILSTGMNSMGTIRKSVAILRKHSIPYGLMHCTSIYPTPYTKIRLNALQELKSEFPDAVIGLSDHSLSNYPCLGAVAMGANILERHFTSDKTWPGPDIEISMDPSDLKELIDGSAIIHQTLGGEKAVLKEEQLTIDFAYACVVSIKDINPGDIFTMENIWVKRPGTGELKAEEFEKILGKRAKGFISINTQLRRSQIEE
ncbi:MAG: N-acetylneuraminate synthase family protein [Candidatus Latescibacteria bacterium]|nr:N-acetylneuraminate synthase family protein [Candidatus Latescibacterota bacterium]